MSVVFDKGILYSKNILKQVDEYLSKYTYQNYSDLRFNVPSLLVGKISKPSTFIGL